jgi:hypothetical protein
MSEFTRGLFCGMLFMPSGELFGILAASVLLHHVVFR